MVQSAGPERRGILGFWALVVTQFQGAFNDNAYKWLITFFLVDLLGKTAAQERQIVAVIGGLFAVPFLLFPVYAGTLADRFSKQRIAVAMKYFELVIMALGLLGFWLHMPKLIWPTLFLMLTQSAFFSPAKYGLLPEILPEKKLSWGNGVIQMGTFVAIILGTVAAGYLYDALAERVYLTSLPLLGLSALGLACSHFITRPPAANPTQRIHANPWSGMRRYFGVLRRDRWLFLTVLGSAYFLFAGALVQMNVMSLGLHGLQLESKGEISALAFALALGMGLGSLACGYLSRGKIEVGLVPLGALGMSVVSVLLASPHFGFAGVSVLLFVLGFSGGVYVVPLSAVLQYRSPADMKGGMIATSNFVSFAGVLLAAVVYAVLGFMGVGPYHLFVVVSLMTMAVGLYICWLLPVFLLRFILWCLTSTLYRVRVLGRDNVPETGGALLVANHTSFIDAVIIAVSIDRPIRFVMFQDIFETAWIKPFAKAMGAIPISASAGPSDLLDSLRTASDAIRSGELVCLFPEGQISRTGQMLPFKKGFERIMRDVDAPIIPIHLDRLWGSVFSFEGGRFFWKIPRRIPYRITVNFGAPMPGDTAPFELRCRIQELGTEAYATRKLDHPLLHRAFVDAVRRHPFMMAMVDGRTPPLSFLKTYVASIIFARKLGKELGPEAMTGVLLPTSVGAALTNVALVLMGKVPVNLNYTASSSARASACEQCGIRHVITSRLFLEKMPMDVPGEVK